MLVVHRREARPAGKRDGWQYYDLPGRRRGLAARRARARRGGAQRARSTRSRLHRSRRRSASCTASRRPSCTAACGTRSTSRARGKVVDALRRAGVLLAPVGVERDRLRRPRLPARLRRVRLAAPRRARSRGRRRSPCTTTRCATRRKRGSTDAEGLARDAEGQRLAVPARQAQARPAEPRPDGALPRRGRRRPRRRRRRRRRRRARAAARAARAGRSSCSRRGRSGTPTATGSATRRAPASGPLLDRQPHRLRQRPDRDGQEQLGRRRRRLDDALRRLRAAAASVGLRGADARRRRRRLADLLLGSEGVVRARRARAAGRRRVLAVGRPARLPARPAPGRGRRRRRVGGRAQLRDRDAGRAGLDHERRLRQPPALHLPRLLPRRLQGEREGLAADHAPPRRDRARLRGARRLHGHARRARRRDRPRDRRHLRQGRRRALPARRRRSPCAATRSRRRGCCSTRRARAIRTGSATTPTRSAAT